MGSPGKTMQSSSIILITADQNVDEIMSKIAIWYVILKVVANEQGMQI